MTKNVNKKTLKKDFIVLNLLLKNYIGISKENDCFNNFQSRLIRKAIIKGIELEKLTISDIQEKNRNYQFFTALMTDFIDIMYNKYLILSFYDVEEFANKYSIKDIEKFYDKDIQEYNFYKDNDIFKKWSNFILNKFKEDDYNAFLCNIFFD